MSISVYVVDDEPMARDRLVYLFNNNLKDEVKLLGSCVDGVTVLEKVPQLKPDMLFLDIELPDITGLELVEKLKFKGYKGKIIFVTGFEQYSIKAIRKGAFDYLLKPVDVLELKEVIKRYKNITFNKFDPVLIKYFNLSAREMEIIELLSKGLSSEKISKKLYISRTTIDTHRRNIHSKTGTKNTVELLNLLTKQ